MLRRIVIRMILLGFLYIEMYFGLIYGFASLFKDSLPEYLYYIFLILIILSTFVTSIIVMYKFRLPYPYLMTFPFGVVLIMMYFFSFHEITNWKSIQVMKIKDLSEISMNPKYSGFYFSNVKVLNQYKETYKKIIKDKNVTSESYFFAAPLVPKDWTSAELIKVWVVCENTNNSTFNDNCTEQWKNNNYKAGILISKSNMYIEDYKQAIKKSQSRHKLASESNPYFMFLVESPEVYVNDMYKKFYIAILGFNLAWLIFVITLLLFRKSREALIVD